MPLQSTKTQIKRQVLGLREPVIDAAALGTGPRPAPTRGLTTSQIPALQQSALIAAILGTGPGPYPKCGQWGHWKMDYPPPGGRVPLFLTALCSTLSNTGHLIYVKYNKMRRPGSHSPITSESKNPRVVGAVCSKCISFLVNTGVSLSVLSEYCGPLLPSSVSVAGMKASLKHLIRLLLYIAPSEILLFYTPLLFCPIVPPPCWAETFSSL